MATKLHIHQGKAALSDFRRKRLADQLKVQDISAHSVHYVALHAGLTETESADLDQLLTYDEVPQPLQATGPADTANKPQTFYVLPRVGTISPWSSKATAQAHVCGLSKVKRIERGLVLSIVSSTPVEVATLATNDQIYDRMTQTLSSEEPDVNALFGEHEPAKLQEIELGDDPHAALQRANKEQGLSLDAPEIEYLAEAFGPNGSLNRNPTDVELFMFSQVNSEHCRHKTFNADWTIDGEKKYRTESGEQKPRTLFSMIKDTQKANPQATVSAYSDNAAVLDGAVGSFLSPQRTGQGVNERYEYKQVKELVHSLIKVETHNHPTAVSPFPGAATGSGGEIRDEGAVGKGSAPKAGLSGFSVSDLLIPDYKQEWELDDVGKPAHISSALQIMLEAPIGSASFNNEFGRPCITGYFRSLLTRVPTGGGDSELRGFHKPIMIAGGVGTVRPQHALKDERDVRANDITIVLGGPAMLIGKLDSRSAIFAMLVLQLQLFVFSLTVRIESGMLTI
jgi:phosphoribosylformylglycinamidine synthase